MPRFQVPPWNPDGLARERGVDGVYSSVFFWGGGGSRERGVDNATRFQSLVTFTLT